MRLHAIVSMTIVLAILAWVADLNIAHAGGYTDEHGNYWITTPGERPSQTISPYRYDDHDRDHENSTESHRYRGPAVIEPHNDEDED
jgi:hypothetical protein